MSFHDAELNVIRWAEANGALHGNEEAQALRAVCHIGALCESIIDGSKVDITEDMGRVAIDMIVLCAMLDIDLAKSLETAFNKISAKPNKANLAALEGFVLRGPLSAFEIDGNAILDEPPSEPMDTSNVVLLKRE